MAYTFAKGRLLGKTVQKKKHQKPKKPWAIKLTICR